jgi:Mn-dependent DtxR family transcriptional regulator
MRAAARLLGISAARVHQILTRDGAERPLTTSDRAILEAIITLSTPVLRGPTAQELASTLGIKPRAVRYRLARLRRLNLIYVDPDRGYLPTDEARPKL